MWNNFALKSLDLSWKIEIGVNPRNFSKALAVCLMVYSSIRQGRKDQRFSLQGLRRYNIDINWIYRKCQRRSKNVWAVNLYFTLGVRFKNKF